MSADAQAYFGTRPGLVPGRRHDVGWGVPADVAAAQSFWAVPGWVGRQQSRRELAAVHRLMSGLPRDEGLGDGREGLVAEFFEDVVAAFEELAREREAGAVAADPGG